MKGEIIRRLSIEVNKEEVVTTDPINKEKDTVKEEDDYLVKTIGAFGLWQAVVSITALLPRIVAGWNMLSLPFLTPVVEFVCVEFSDNFTTVEVNKSICYENCLKYNYTSEIGRSIVEDFGLICQNAWLASFAQSVLMLGYLIGASLFSWISDKFGRRTAMVQSTFLNAVLMIALPFSTSYIVFSAIRFIIGIASGGSIWICVVQVMEITGKRYIELAGVCVFLPLCVAQAFLAGFAYFTSDWQGYTLSYGVATCVIFILILFVPESPRWLVANGRIDEAIKVITSAANRNNLDTSNIKAIITKLSEELKLKDCETVKVSYMDFFKTKYLFMTTLFVFLIWFFICLCFYGIYQYVTIIGFDPYLTVVMLGLVPIPFLPLSIIINKRFGRKAGTLGTLGGIAVATLILTFVDKGHWLGSIFGVIAFISCNISMTITYVHISELYPTPLRNMGFGLPSCGSKLSSIISPFIVNLLPRWLPSLVFCLSAFIAALCCLALPETKGRNLKDVVEK